MATIANAIAITARYFISSSTAGRSDWNYGTVVGFKYAARSSNKPYGNGTNERERVQNTTRDNSATIANVAVNTTSRDLEFHLISRTLVILQTCGLLV